MSENITPPHDHNQTNPLETTEFLQGLDAAHNMHPFTHNGELAEKGARMIVKGQGVYLWDSDGNKMLDAMAGLWTAAIGHGREEMADAVYAQMRDLPFYNLFFQTSTAPAAKLAAKLATLTPGDLNHVFFTLGGSDANDTILRAVRHYWETKDQPEKRTVIGRINGYHGSTIAAASMGGMSFMHEQGSLPIPDITHINQPYWYREAALDQSPEEFCLARAQELETKILEIGADKVAAFIGEPLQGSGGVIIPTMNYWPEIQRICDKYDVLLIADEVICGFGRTGEWFGANTFGFQPDIMSIAKGLTSGYLPLGAAIFSDKVAKVLYDDGGEFEHGFTYSGHATSCAAALKNIEIIEREGLVERVKNDIGPYLQKQWEQLADHPLVGEARMIGLVGAIEMTPDKSTRAKFESKLGTVGYICREICFRNGLIMRHVGDTMIISPPLVLSHQEADELIKRAKQCLDETLEEINQQGIK